MRWTFTSTPQTFGAKLMGPIFGLLFKGVMRKCMQRDLDALRDAAGSGSFAEVNLEAVETGASILA